MNHSALSNRLARLEKSPLWLSMDAEERRGICEQRKAAIAEREAVHSRCLEVEAGLTAPAAQAEKLLTAARERYESALTAVRRIHARRQDLFHQKWQADAALERVLGETADTRLQAIIAAAYQAADAARAQYVPGESGATSTRLTDIAVQAGTLLAMAIEPQELDARVDQLRAALNTYAPGMAAA